MMPVLFLFNSDMKESNGDKLCPSQNIVDFFRFKLLELWGSSRASNRIEMCSTCEPLLNSNKTPARCTLKALQIQLLIWEITIFTAKFIYAWYLIKFHYEKRVDRMTRSIINTTKSNIKRERHIRIMQNTQSEARALHNNDKIRRKFLSRMPRNASRKPPTSNDLRQTKSAYKYNDYIISRKRINLHVMNGKSSKKIKTTQWVFRGFFRGVREYFSTFGFATVNCSF